MKPEDRDSTIRMLLEAEQARLRKALKTLQCDSDLETARSADTLDDASTTAERYNNVARRTFIQAELVQTEEALNRVNDGVYRICRRCGLLIESGRLEAFPSATLCLKCKKEEERKTLKYKNPHCWS